MSSFKNFSSMLNDLQRQADGRGTLDGSAIEDFLSIAGYEDPAGGGGGSVEVTVTLDTLTIPETSITGEDDGYGGYEKIIDLGVTAPSEITDGVPYNENCNYSIFITNGTIYGPALQGLTLDIDGVSVTAGGVDGETGHYTIIAASENAFTIVFPSTVMTYYRMSEDVADKTPVNAAIIVDNGLD